jgi:hypothetical protein
MQQNHRLTSAIKGRIVRTIGQSGQDLLIEFEDGSKMHIKLAEPTSSVTVRDAQNRMEYAD